MMSTFRVFKRADDCDPTLWMDLGEVQVGSAYKIANDLGALEGEGTYLAWEVDDSDYGYKPKEYVVIATTPQYEIKDDEL
jgi:hypothetical protein